MFTSFFFFFLNLISLQWKTGPRFQTFPSVTRMLQALREEEDSIVSDPLSQLRRLYGKVSNQEKLVIAIDKLRVRGGGLCVLQNCNEQDKSSTPCVD